MKKTLVVLALVAIVAVGASARSASANHSWSTYHWGRTANPFTLKVGNNVSSSWTQYLTNTSTVWNKSSVLQTSVVAGQASGKCRGTTGRVEVCSGTYGNNGWLGLASISLSGGHISVGTVKVNDTYFNTPTYNNPNEREHVMCQEVGHTFGLDHQDTSGAAFYTCMDYFSNTGANATSTTSTAPDQGDYDQLTCIYDPNNAGKTLTSTTNGITHSCTGTGHLDSTTTIGAAVPSSLGKMPANAHPGKTRYVQHFRNGVTQVTWIIWAKNR